MTTVLPPVPVVEDPDVTVVVMTRDRLPDLRASLPHHRAPVVLVDNGSSDGTADAAPHLHPDLRVLALGRNEGAVARNRGVAAALTPFVAFADDDSWWAAGALARAADVLRANPRVAVVAARLLVGPQERLDPVCTQMAGSPLPMTGLPGPRLLGFVACGAVVRRDAFLSVGGFDAVVGFRGEEERLALDLTADGWACSYVDDVVAHHHPSTARGPSAAAVSRQTRNHVLTAVMRRPWDVVRRRAADGWRAGPSHRRGLLAAVPRLPVALRARRRLPAAVEGWARTLEVEDPSLPSAGPREPVLQGGPRL